MRQAALLEALILLAIGAAGVLDSIAITASEAALTTDPTGPGRYVLLVSALLCVVSLAYLLDTLRVPARPGIPALERHSGKAVSLLVVLAAYAAVVDWIGYGVSTFVFFVAVQAIMADDSWLKRAVFALGGTALFHALFIWLSGIPIGYQAIGF
jgi:hypothetical protein